MILWSIPQVISEPWTIKVNFHRNSFCCDERAKTNSTYRTSKVIRHHEKTPAWFSELAMTKKQQWKFSRINFLNQSYAYCGSIAKKSGMSLCVKISFCCSGKCKPIFISLWSSSCCWLQIYWTLCNGFPYQTKWDIVAYILFA